MAAKRKNPFQDFVNNKIEPEKKKEMRNFQQNKTQKWEKHQEAAMGYYFHINGKKYCYVTEYKGDTLIHIRIYDENDKTGALIPTKTGCCLRVNEWGVLRKVGPEVLTEEVPSDDIMRRPLGPTSNWYILFGADDTDQLAVSIRLLMPTKNKKSHELYSTSKGLTFVREEWEKFTSLFDDINEVVESIEQCAIY